MIITVFKPHLHFLETHKFSKILSTILRKSIFGWMFKTSEKMAEKNSRKTHYFNFNLTMRKSFSKAFPSWLFYKIWSLIKGVGLKLLLKEPANKLESIIQNSKIKLLTIQTFLKLFASTFLMKMETSSKRPNLFSEKWVDSLLSFTPQSWSKWTCNWLQILIQKLKPLSQNPTECNSLFALLLKLLRIP